MTPEYIQQVTFIKTMKHELGKNILDFAEITLEELRMKMAVTFETNPLLVIDHFIQELKDI
jgi:hypothetical protein